MPLPARFTSLYRISLRACAAAVKHHPTATRQLRLLYRPAFERAGQRVLKLVESEEKDEGREKWFTEWEERMHRALALMVLSANPNKSAAPTRLTRNLSMIRHTRHPSIPSQANLPVRWDAQDPSDALAKHELYLSRNANLHKAYFRQGLDRALGEMSRAAEGSCRVVLGSMEGGVLGRRVRPNWVELMPRRKSAKGAARAARSAITG